MRPGLGGGMRAPLLALVPAALIIAMVVGCGGPKYNIVGAGSRMPAKATVAIAVLSDSGGGAMGMLGAKSGKGKLLGIYLTTVFLDHGYEVRALDFELLAGNKLPNLIFPPRTEAAETRSDPDATLSEPPESSGNEEIRHFKALAELARLISPELEIDYLVAAFPLGGLSFAAYAVDVRNRLVRRTVIFTGNSKGFELAMGMVDSGKRVDAEYGDVTKIDALRTAEYIAAKLAAK